MSESPSKFEWQFVEAVGFECPLGLRAFVGVGPLEPVGSVHLASEFVRTEVVQFEAGLCGLVA